MIRFLIINNNYRYKLAKITSNKIKFLDRSYKLKYHKIKTIISLTLTFLNTSYTMEPIGTKSRQSWIEPDSDPEFNTNLEQSWSNHDFANYSYAESNEDPDQISFKFNWTHFYITEDIHLTRFGAYSDILTDYHIYALENSKNQDRLHLKEFMIKKQFIEEKTQDIIIKETKNYQNFNSQDARKVTNIQSSKKFHSENPINNSSNSFQNNSILQEIHDFQSNNSDDNSDRDYPLKNVKKTKKKQKTDKENCIIS